MNDSHDSSLSGMTRRRSGPRVLTLSVVEPAASQGDGALEGTRKSARGLEPALKVPRPTRSSKPEKVPPRYAGQKLYEKKGIWTATIDSTPSPRGNELSWFYTVRRPRSSASPRSPSKDVRAFPERPGMHPRPGPPARHADQGEIVAVVSSPALALSTMSAEDGRSNGSPPSTTTTGTST